MKKAASSLFYRAALLIIAAAFLPQNAHGFWPFSSGKEEAYVARVGSEVITSAEYLEGIKKLHMSSRVGKSLAETQSFGVQDYRKFLSELIDNRLMKMEAENIGLDKEPELISSMNMYILNMGLGQLRQDEVIARVNVDDAEIEEYHRQQLRQKEEQEKKLKEKQGASEKSDIPKEKPPEASVQEPEKKMSPKERENIKNTILAGKAAAREKEYFKGLRDRADVKKDEALLKAYQADKPETMDAVLASVDADPIRVRDLVLEFKASKTNDTPSARGQMLDTLILHKLLDRETKMKGYAQRPDFKEKATRYRDALLINGFKRKAIAGGITIEEKEIADYYEKNREKYREPDRVDLSVILVYDKAKAEAVLAELKKGADFAYLAGKDSADKSGEKGGRVGWVNIDFFPVEFREGFYKARNGDYFGPVTVEGANAVVEFHALEKGSYTPLEKISVEIARTIGNERFKAKLDEYLKRLRQAVPVEINEKELRLLEGNEGAKEGGS